MSKKMATNCLYEGSTRRAAYLPVFPTQRLLWPFPVPQDRRNCRDPGSTTEIPAKARIRHLTIIVLCLISVLDLSRQSAAQTYPSSHSSMCPIGSTRNRIPDTLPNGYFVHNWTVFGPFVPRNASIPAERDADYLKAFQLSESSIRMSTVEALATRVATFMNYTATSRLVSLSGVFPDLDYTVAYIATEICAPRPRNVSIILGNGASRGVWLNGVRIFANTIWRSFPAHAYDSFYIVHLHKGLNFILVKVGFIPRERIWHNERDNRWEFILGLEDPQIAWSQMAHRWKGRLLAKHLFPDASAFVQEVKTLAFAPTQFGPAAKQTITITNRNYVVKYDHARLSTETALPNPPILPEGLYTITLQSEFGAVADRFYVGDTHRIMSQLIALRDRQTNSRIHLAMDALLQRYNILTTPQYSRPDDDMSQREIVMVVSDALSILHASRQNSWMMQPGMHLRSYISDLDGLSKATF